MSDGNFGHVWRRAIQQNHSQTLTLFFHAAEQAARPSIFSSQDSQAEQDREPPGQRRQKHRHAQRKERETRSNPQASLCGL